MNADVRQLEEERLQQVLHVLRMQMETAGMDQAEKQEHVSDLRRGFWDQVSVNLTNDTERLETYTSLIQEARVLADQERHVNQLKKQLSTYDRMLQSPYFGRIDFREQGGEQQDLIYIGLSSLLAEDEMNFLVYDWRAPISSLFYDHSPGPADYETPDGNIHGEMTLKRQFVIKYGELLHLFDTDVTIGDAFLQQALSQHANAQMKNIVATIQKEQNQVIREDRSKVLIVQGAAGSGKTSAALQRVAYLLYKHRQTLNPDQIVLFSPNPLFNSYIATVLPELGEANMRQTTFQDYLRKRLGRMYQLEDLYDQQEFVHTGAHDAAGEARRNAISFKASQQYYSILLRYLERLGTEGMCFRNVSFQNRVMVSANDIREQFYSLNDTLVNRLANIQKWLLAQLDELELAERTQPWVQEAIELLDAEDYQEVYSELRSKGHFHGNSFSDAQKERAFLRRKVVAEAYAPLRKWVKKQRFLDIPRIYQQLFEQPDLLSMLADHKELPRNLHQICDLTCRALESKQLFYEDATPLIFLMEGLMGFPEVDNQVKYVLVDEAQDYSPFQFAYLKKMFPRAKFTMLGDLNQAIFLQTAEMGAFDALKQLFDSNSVSTMRLTMSYRSTKPIVEFTRSILPAGAVIEPFEREGKAPVVQEFAEQIEMHRQILRVSAQLLQNGHRMIGILCKSAMQSNEVQEALNSMADGVVQLVEKNAEELPEGLTVLPIYLAKGIEFDAVIVYNASQQSYGEESDRKLLYTACTRAMHELHVYSIGEVSSFIPRM